MSQEKKYLQTVGSFECIIQAPGLDGEGKSFGWIAMSRDKGTPSVRLPLMVSEGPHRGEITVCHLWLNSDENIDRTTIRLAEAIGFDGDWTSLRKGLQTFAGRPCNIQTEMEEQAGYKPRLKVKWLNPPGGGGSKAVALADDKVDSIFKNLNVAKTKALAKDARAAAAKTGVAPAPASAMPTAVADEPPHDDDVPF